MKSCSNDLDHMTKIAVYPCMVKQTIKIFFSRTKRRMTFGHLAFCRGKMKILYFSGTIAAYDLKVGRCIELNLMKLQFFIV